MEATAPPMAAESAPEPNPQTGNGLHPVFTSRIPSPPAPLPEPLFGARGTPVTLADGRAWMLPPLLLDDVFGRAGELVLAIASVGGRIDGDAVKAEDLIAVIFSGAKDWLYDLAFLAFRRNYPTILQREDVPGLFDTQAAFDFLHAIVDPLREQFARLGLGALVPGRSGSTPGR